MLSMKFKFAIVITTCIATLLFACKKQNTNEVRQLYGKWKLIEIYDEYGSGELTVGVMFRAKTHTV